MKKTIKADKTSLPLTQAQKAALDTKTITKNESTGQIWPGRSELRPEPRYDGPQGQEIDLEYQRRMNTNDGRWSPGAMADEQPRSGPGQYLNVQELPIMPEDVIGPTNEKDPLPQPKGNKKTIASVKAGQWGYDAKPTLLNDE
jgi:hypothetical protein